MQQHSVSFCSDDRFHTERNRRLLLHARSVLSRRNIAEVCHAGGKIIKILFGSVGLCDMFKPWNCRIRGWKRR